MSPITFPPYRTIVHLFEACVKYHTCNSHPARWRSPQHQNTDMLISHALPHNNFSLAQQKCSIHTNAYRAYGVDGYHSTVSR
ncbi:hypothetical protein FHX51_000314 [Aeriscardovia aeriphila]|uniref:Uncharacterized protein n=1 Tax=Aeriscardovia aeriphila TaxID=218139 RepID=A0A261FBF0_9BIFI|nr:hypothetical protein [Aeriscardovia aeriphila]OZG56480.1 hypothetical protein AEAE_0968 [Aeriscardovia aeriphila]